jgi:ABC-type Fe3+-hydroxamate transport system substrate-binding protein
MRSRTPARLAVLTLTTSLAAACGRDVAPQDAALSSGIERPPTHLEQVVVRHAEHFEVEYRDGFKLVRTRGEVTEFQTTNDPQQLEDVMVLVPRGAAPPALEGELRGATVVQVPVGSIAVNNDDLLALVTQLGLREDLRATAGLYTYDDTVRARVERGDLGQLQYSWHLPPDIEVLLSYAPELTFLAVDSPHNIPALARVRGLGIAAAPTFAWAEQDYLGRAEWIKHIAVFLNLEHEANRIFGEIEARVLELKQLASHVVDTPTVLWGYHAGNGRWFMAANNLEARLLRDAAVRNPLEDFGGPVRADGEEYGNERLLVEGADAEHWIIGDIHGSALPPAAFMGEFRAWRSDHLYHNYARTKPEVNAYDWYEGAVARPDLMLADVIALFHPGLLPEHQLTYLGHYDKERPGP